MALVLLLISLLLLVIAAFAFLRLRRTTAERNSTRIELDRLIERFRGVVDAEAERAAILATLENERNAARLDAERQQAALAQRLAAVRRELEAGAIELANVHGRIEELRREFAVLDEEANLQSFGFYKPHYSFADSEQYQRELERIRDEQKLLLKEKRAAICQTEWTVNGSKTEGRKQINQTLKLMLRAFNGECDAAIAKVRYNNVHVMEARIHKAFDTINNLAEVQQCQVTMMYRDLRLQELRLAHEYEEKLQEEKEEQRRIREQMREEEIALREIEKARQDAEREEQRYEQALAKAREEAERAVGARQEKLLGQIEDLQRKLAEAHTNKERAIARAQMTRSGHVYVISNIGSFGEHVYKIGMTRRLEPLDRIKELGDASVPFQFDVHAVIFSEDAPALENALHKIFHQHRVNLVNERKEFFRIALDEIAAAVRAHKGDVLFTRVAEAAEYRKTVAMLEADPKRTPLLPIRASAEHATVNSGSLVPVSQPSGSRPSA
jgi:hypothetical protein